MRIKFLSSLIPQKDDNMDEKTRDTFYKYIHQKKMDNNSLTPKILKELIKN